MDVSGEPLSDVYSLETGTGLDQIQVSRPDVGFDCVFAGELFSGVRLDQPEEDTFCTTQGIDSISVTLWGVGTRSVDVNVSGKGVADQTCPQGMSSVLPANIECNFVLRPTEGYNFTFFIDPAKFSKTFQDDHPAGKVAEVHTDLFGRDEFLFQMVDAYIREYEAAQDFSSIALETIAMRVSLHLARNYSSWRDASPSDTISMHEHDRIARVKEYIETLLHKPLTLSEIAEVACLSQYHFSRCFKAIEGSSPHQYIIQRRLGRARRLLEETDFSLSHIAYLCGFSSQQHMTDQFRKQVGVTPGVMRRELLK